MQNACVISKGGVYDSIVYEFGSFALQWQEQINPFAQKIFFLLFGMEFMWQLTVKKVFAGDIEKLWVFFFTRTTLCFFFAKYFVDVKLYFGIIQYFINIGGALSTFKITLDTGHNFPIMGPSEIIGYFSCMIDATTEYSNTTFFQNIPQKIFIGLMQMGLFVSLGLIAYCIMKTILQAYLLLYAGFILTGFAGSSWTMGYFQKYMQLVLSIAMKFLTINLILGALNIRIIGWIHDINNINSLDMAYAVMLRIFGSTIVITLMIYQLPEWIANNLASTISMPLNNAISSFMSGVSFKNSAVGTSASSDRYLVAKAQYENQNPQNNEPDLNYTTTPPYKNQPLYTNTTPNNNNQANNNPSTRNHTGYGNLSNAGVQSTSYAKNNSNFANLVSLMEKKNNELQ